MAILGLAVEVSRAAPAIAAGGTCSLILKSDGSAWGTGFNDWGQIGTGNVTAYYLRPVQIPSLSGITAISAGYAHSLFLKNNGTVWATGNNEAAQLGIGSYAHQSTPVQVPLLRVTTAISAGQYHSLFLANDGKVWTAGANTLGQLGTGMGQWHSPIQIPSLSGITAISAGQSHSLFLKNDSSVWSTGYAGDGQLGIGNVGSQNTPVQISSLSGITAIAAGAEHSLFLKDNGSVWATGGNDYGQLGIGNVADQRTPVQIPSLSGITAISSGGYHSLFLKNNGTVWATGANVYGALGTGDTTQRNSPVQVASLNSITAIFAGHSNSFFLGSDNRVWVTGYGITGQLGTGNSANLNLPANPYSMESASQTITFPTIGDRLLTSPTVSLTGTAAATTTSGLPITYAVVSGPATRNGTTLTLTGEGTVTVSASQAGNTIYAAASVSQTFSVSRVPQIITFPAVTNRPFASAPISLQASSSSGLPVSYSIVSGPATMNGSLLQMTGAGTITVRASQPGNAIYLPAASQEVTFTVAPNTAGPSFLAISKTWFYDNAPLNTLIGALSAPDPDAGDLVTYSLVFGVGSEDNAEFGIADDKLRTDSTAFDYETARTASVRVRATDSAGQFTEQVFILNIMSASPNARFIPAGPAVPQGPNYPSYPYVNAFFMLVGKSTGRGIIYPRSFFDPGSPDYQPDLFHACEGATEFDPTIPIAYGESYFQVGKKSDVPTKVRTVILLDCSNSISLADLALIRTAAKRMVDNMFEEQEIAVYSFSGTWTRLHDFSANQSTLKAAIDTLSRGSASTNLYGSMLAMLSLPTWIESFKPTGIETGFLVVLTDGADSTGAATKDQVKDKRDREGKKIYTIGLGTAIQPAVLDELQNTNFYRPVSQAAELAAAFDDIQKDILDLANSFYQFNYVSPKRASAPPGTLRKLEVKLKNNINPDDDRLLRRLFNSDEFEDIPPPRTYINRTVNAVTGIITTHSISRDLPETAYGITLFPPLDFSSFTWTIGNPALATLTPQGAIGERVIITPNGQDGTTTLTLKDTISNYTKTIELVIGTGVAVPPATLLANWAASAGLTGAAAGPNAIPFGDGVENLLKYAFNMNASGPDASVLTAGGVSGLPRVTVDDSGPEPVLRVEFLRRKGSGLIYTPQRSDTLGGFVPMTGTPTVSSINAQWERVSVAEPAPPGTAENAFARVQVSLP